MSGVKAFDVVDAVCNRFPKVFSDLKFVVVPDSRLPHAEAEANSATHTILIRESTYEAAVNWRPRERFIVAEELCHIALNHSGPRHRNCAGRPVGYSYSERQDEREARIMAAFLLAPTELAQHCTSKSEVKDQFLMSNQAAEIRWEQLERHRRHKAGQKRQLPLGVIDFLRIQRSKGFRIQTDLDE